MRTSKGHCKIVRIDFMPSSDNLDPKSGRMRTWVIRFLVPTLAAIATVGLLDLGERQQADYEGQVKRSTWVGGEIQYPAHGEPPATELARGLNYPARVVAAKVENPFDRKVVFLLGVVVLWGGVACMHTGGRRWFVQTRGRGWFLGICYLAVAAALGSHALTRIHYESGGFTRFCGLLWAVIILVWGIRLVRKASSVGVQKSPR